LWLELRIKNLRLIERNPTIAIFQIRYGYLHRIGFFNRVLNRRPEKCGFEKIKRAILKAQIHPFEL
jgi:hypothetical protein